MLLFFGDACKDTETTIELLSSGSIFDVWKQSYTQISTAGSDKKQNFYRCYDDIGIKVTPCKKHSSHSSLVTCSFYNDD